MAGTLRITGGYLLRRRFAVPPQADRGLVRPAADRVRQAIFSSLGEKIKQAQVLDLFAGSGAYGFEALSRGAAGVVFIEKSREIAECISKNAQHLGVYSQCEIKCLDALEWICKKPFRQFDFIFLDPPYSLHLPESFWQSLRGWLSAAGCVIFRCHPSSHFLSAPNYDVLRQRKYGGTEVFFLSQKHSNLL